MQAKNMSFEKIITYRGEGGGSSELIPWVSQWWERKRGEGDSLRSGVVGEWLKAMEERLFRAFSSIKHNSSS